MSLEDLDYIGASMAGYEEQPVKKTPLKGRKTALAARTEYSKTKYSGGQTGEFTNISRGITPFDDGNGCISVRDAIELMQKAYYNIDCVRGALDVMVDLANSNLKFVGGNKTARKFFTAWEKKINNRQFRNEFFLEFWRSCNVFIYRHDGKLTYSDYRKVTRAAQEEKAAVTKTIPIKYSILNPADIRVNPSASFVNATYSKILNAYEVKRLQTPSTPEEKEFVKSLPQEEREKIKKGNSPELTLSPDKLIAIFNGKASYEPMAAPCFYPCLQNINFKIELRKTEMVLARTADRMILLVTCGEKDRDAAMNEKLREGITQLFSQDSVGRVLISDYTTKAEFVIPDLGKVFGADKYKAVNEDIANALMNIFWKDESFSNSMIKVQIFLERLKTARETYVNSFLKPEMERIAEELGFQEVPEVQWEDFALKDDLEYKKLYVRLAELGLLTQEETIEAWKTHQLPTTDDSVESQRKFKKLKKEELYEPLMGKPKEDAGRPTGAKAPKKKVKVSPVGASEGFSLQRITDNIKLINSINLMIEAAYKEKNGLERLSKKNKEVCWHITESLVTNEPRAEWESKIAEYLVEAKSWGSETDRVFSLAAEHNVPPIMGAVLADSIIPAEEEEV